MHFIIYSLLALFIAAIVLLVVACAVDRQARSLSQGGADAWRGGNPESRVQNPEEKKTQKIIEEWRAGK